MKINAQTKRTDTHIEPTRWASALENAAITPEARWHFRQEILAFRGACRVQNIPDDTSAIRWHLERVPPTRRSAAHQALQWYASCFLT